MPALIDRLGDADPAVRYWAAVGLGALEKKGNDGESALLRALKDSKPWVRVTAADALARLGRIEPALPILTAAMKDPSEWVRLQAIAALDRLDAAASSARKVIQEAEKDTNEDVAKVARHALKAF